MSTPEGYTKQRPLKDETKQGRRRGFGAPLRMCECCWHRMEAHETHEMCQSCLNERRHIEQILTEIRLAFPATKTMSMLEIFRKLWAFRKAAKQ